MKLIKLLAITILFGFILNGCQPPAEKDGMESTEAEIAAKKDVLVRVSGLEKTTIARTIDYNSTLQAFEEVYIAPATPGRIEKIFVEPGDRVSKGQKLFLMDQTQLHQTRIQVKSMEVDIARMETLLKTGSITQQAYDQLKTQYDVTNASLEFLEKNTTMYAPFAGVITGKYFENGEIYSGAPNTQAGKASVVTLMQINPLKAVLKISESYYPLVKNGMKATITSDVYKGEEISGKVILVYPTIDQITRSFEVEIEIPNSSGKLRPGMFARVSILVGESETYVVSSNTVLQQEGTNVRYLFIENNGVARRYNVTIGKRFDEKIEILSDEISDGARIIVEGHTKLMDGDKVKVVE
jgi:RND family efflux transporter MFP subunit